MHSGYPILGPTGSLSRLAETCKFPGAHDIPSVAASTRPGHDGGCHGSSIRHVLAPLDRSPLAESALPWAVAVARALSARITLLHVVETAAGRDATDRHQDAVKWEIRRIEAHNHLARLGSDLEASGLKVGIELLEGRPAERIVDFAQGNHIDLVVLSTHGEGGLSGWAMSSTAQMIAARTRSSVLVVPAHAADRERGGRVLLRRILVPLDCSPRAECILPLATALARAHDAELILAHVAPKPEMPRRMPPSAEDLALASQLTERNRVEGNRYLGELRARIAEQAPRIGVRVVVSSRRASAIRALAEQVDANLVMVCAHGTTGDASERYGSVAARLLEDADRPIIVFQDLPEKMLEPTRAEAASRSHPGH